MKLATIKAVIFFAYRRDRNCKTKAYTFISLMDQQKPFRPKFLTLEQLEHVLEIYLHIKP